VHDDGRLGSRRPAAWIEPSGCGTSPPDKPPPSWTCPERSAPSFSPPTARSSRASVTTWSSSTVHREAAQRITTRPPCPRGEVWPTIHYYRAYHRHLEKRGLRAQSPPWATEIREVIYTLPRGARRRHSGWRFAIPRLHPTRPSERAIRGAGVGQKLEDLVVVVPGILTRFGCTRCRCHTDPGHLPYPSWIRKAGAKTITCTLSPAQLERVPSPVRQHQAPARAD
jgi:hypothetical protein